MGISESRIKSLCWALGGRNRWISASSSESWSKQRVTGWLKLYNEILFQKQRNQQQIFTDSLIGNHTLSQTATICRKISKIVKVLSFCMYGYSGVHVHVVFIEIATQFCIIYILINLGTPTYTCLIYHNIDGKA